MQGWRRSMEDAKIVELGESPFLVGVLDGHGGDSVSSMASRQFPALFRRQLAETGCIRAALERALPCLDSLLEQELKPKDRQLVGSTFNVVVFDGPTLYCANVGDSRAVLSRHGRAVPLSWDHRPDCAKELARIEAAGGFV
jgi:serine/threonine protein phosphatase PrpC